MKSYKQELNVEQKIIINCSKLQIDEKSIKFIKEIIQNNTVDWYMVLRYCLKNKITGMVWKNLKDLNLLDYLPQDVNYAFSFFYYGTRQRNEYLLSVQQEIEEFLQEANIKFVRLKGGCLLNSVYRDLGLRFMNDLDYLISSDDADKIKKNMKLRGFENGNIKINSGCLTPHTRKDELVWKTKMNNLPPFFRFSDNEYCPIIDIDFCMYLDYNMNRRVTDIMLKNAIGNNLSKVDLMLHLCAHLYKEATNASWILLGTDITIMKFCDVREVMLRLSNAECDELIKKAYAYDLHNAVYYSLYYLSMIYSDDIIQDILLQFKDDVKLEILEQFGEREFGEPHKWKQAFLYRLFNGSNEEISKDEEFFNFIK